MICFFEFLADESGPILSAYIFTVGTLLSYVLFSYKGRFSFWHPVWQPDKVVISLFITYQIHVCTATWKILSSFMLPLQGFSTVFHFMTKGNKIFLWKLKTSNSAESCIQQQAFHFTQHGNNRKLTQGHYLNCWLFSKWGYSFTDILFLLRLYISYVS